MSSGLKRTHLYGFHRKHGRLTEFAGFEHALWYEGIMAEHAAVRESVGVFDVTHMGRTLIEGPASIELLEKLLPRRVSNMSLKQGRYAFFLNEDGGIVDDLTIFRLDERKFLVVYNSGNRAKDFAWIKSHSEGLDVTVRDISDEVVMLAVQGPKALSTLQKLSNVNLASIKRYWCEWVKLGDFKVLASRSGYTGEDGFEIYLWDTPLEMAERAEKLLEDILQAGQEYGIKPCGLGARDTLRLEAGMCLYGQDIDERTSPLEAGLGMLVDLDKQNFVGKEALVKLKDQGIRRSRVCIRLEGKGVPRNGFEVYCDSQKVGNVTSGTYSPILKTGIAMGYVEVEHARVGTQVYVKIREERIRGRVVEPPFYDTTKYGYKRIT
jgi:aminomethyltransferase